MYICKFGQKIHTYHFFLIVLDVYKIPFLLFYLLPTMINDYVHTSIFLHLLLHFRVFFFVKGKWETRTVSIFLLFFFGQNLTKIFTKSLFILVSFSSFKTIEFPCMCLCKVYISFFFLIFKSTIMFTPYHRFYPQTKSNHL